MRNGPPGRGAYWRAEHHVRRRSPDVEEPPRSRSRGWLGPMTRCRNTMADGRDGRARGTVCHRPREARRWYSSSARTATTASRSKTGAAEWGCRSGRAPSTATTGRALGGPGGGQRRSTTTADDDLCGRRRGAHPATAASARDGASAPARGSGNRSGAPPRTCPLGGRCHAEADRDRIVVVRSSRLLARPI
jgi:hypothetical protein